MQNRFKSETIEDEGYLLAVARYIHNNPVKARIVEKVSSYLWSSYNGYINEGNPRNFITRDMILGILSVDRKKAIKLFIEYTEQKNEDEFLDHVEINEGKTIKGHWDASAYVQNFLGNQGISLSKLNDKENIATRNELICQLRTCSNLSVREVAELLSLNRRVIQRIKT